jgi:RimJ/RimL family protein N-acetyltransferase
MAGSDTPGRTPDRNTVHIEIWGKGDLPLLQQLNAPEMTAHLGGPESAEKIAERQSRYEQLVHSTTDRMFKIVLDATGESVGSVGYWQRNWHGEQVFEMGWGVVPAFQGRGIASAATSQAIARARSEGTHRFLHAFPSVENQPSNALCQRLGFTRQEEVEFEYPAGHVMQCNDWYLDLFADR